MRQPHCAQILFLSASLFAPLYGQGSGSLTTSSPPAWSPQGAATYLDGRIDWWMGWSKSARDHETFCISCHTAVPYAMSRAALRKATGEAAPSPQEVRLFENVRKRVRMWDAAEPFYQDASSGAGKSRESRGTESVLNSLVLVFPTSSENKLSAEAEMALKNMWATQETEGARKGAFPWLEFRNRPWEGDSIYYGAALAAIAVGSAPEEYRLRAAVAPQVNLLRDYLRREYGNASPVNRVVTLWAAAKLPDLLDGAQKKMAIIDICALQQPDGGWNLGSLVGPWSRRDGTPLDARSDGYATGLVVFALEQNHVSADDEHLRRALKWLQQNQSADEGLWPATSLNKERDPASDPGRFMSDAATAYAVLALTSAH